MPDHLQLSPAVTLTGKRRPPGGSDPDAPPVDRHAKATTVAGLLAGLESNGRPVFGNVLSADGDSDDEIDELGTVVLKFTTVGAPVKGPFSGMKMTPLGENSDNEFYVLSSQQSRAMFSELVRNYDPQITSSDWDQPKTWAKLLDQIAGIEIYGPSDRQDASLRALDFALPQAVDVILWPTSLLRDSTAKNEGVARTTAIVDVVEAAQQRDQRLQVLSMDTRPDTLFVRATVDEQLLEDLLDNPLVEKVRGPLAPVIEPSDLTGDGDREDPAQPDGSPIGVIDDLVITSNPWVRNVLQDQASFPLGSTLGGATGHGTFVASIAAYGNLEAAVRGEAVEQPFPIYSARVSEAGPTGSPQISGDIIQKFEQAIDWLANHGVRVAVIAFAYDHADLEALPTELTVTMDRLARDHRMVLVVSAGNVRDIRGHWRDDYPEYLKTEDALVAAPGTAALALTVGAIAHRDIPSDRTLTAIAPVGHPSPFSRRGPVRGNRESKTQKPELSGPGGNWGWGASSSVPVPRDPGLAVVGLSTKNTPMFVVNSGTSAAAPYVAHEVAKIATRYPNAGPNLLRAVTALSTPAIAVNSHPLAPALAAAYGLPQADRVLESGGNRAILVFEGSIDAGGRVIHEIPIPPEFAQAAATERHLRIVLAFDPPVKRSRRDYIAGRMQFDFVRNMSLEDVKRTWEAQPTVAERAAGAHYDPLPTGNERPKLEPGVMTAHSNTLIRRDIATQTWDEDDDTYFLVVSHDRSPWTVGQLRPYPTQEYAIAIELVDVGRETLDLHSLVEARLAAQNRIRGRAR